MRLWKEPCTTINYKFNLIVRLLMHEKLSESSKSLIHFVQNKAKKCKMILEHDNNSKIFAWGKKWHNRIWKCKMSMSSKGNFELK